MRTEMWRAAHRLISHRSKNLCDPRWNPNFHNSIQSYSSGSIAICNFLFLDLNFSSAQGLFVSRYRSTFFFSGFTYNFGRPCKPFNPYLRRQGSDVQICIYPTRDYIENLHGSTELCYGKSFRIQNRFYGSATTKIQRNPIFSTINSDDINHFREILGEKNVIQDEDRLSAANMDWMRKYKGSSKLLLQPRSTEEVSQILKYCNSRCLAVVPQGGNTGLVGGSVPVFDEVIINIGSMNNIISFDKVGMMHFLVSGILVCEAGCILENLISFVDNQG
ncbi:putative D-2-hydroxyglutarate dehydrogenase, mitochondrial [Vitis vinifera]|uniref:Putative D-2-hydroxyglutarate dehydrogenase, mitochondrial n=1 Tax=Vitis vinifera TaxID=29760 RepID=A0A438K5H9_VITVI|nr:putative D-2-hydroxyglutarate dehydrogenase, mitochondrial [Vitis vinifera]